jgi:putative endonuclease
MNTKKIGDIGEEIAERYLKKKGYEILDKNYCFRIAGSPQQGEIDIIAKRGSLISFVEVKTLQSKGFSRLLNPEDKVDFWKRKRIIKTAEYWLNKNKTALDSRWQVDTIAVIINPFDKKARVKHLKNVATY